METSDKQEEMQAHWYYMIVVRKGDKKTVVKMGPARLCETFDLIVVGKQLIDETFTYTAADMVRVATDEYDNVLSETVVGTVNFEEKGWWCKAKAQREKRIAEARARMAKWEALAEAAAQTE